MAHYKNYYFPPGRFPPQSCRSPELASAHAPALLSCGSCASRRRPCRASASLVWRSRLVVQKSTSRSSRRRHPVVTRPLVTFLRLQPASEFDPETQRVAAFALPRFSAPSALPNRRDLPLPGVPTWVTLRPRAYHAPRRFTPSTISLVSFQPGALTGFALQSLT